MDISFSDKKRCIDDSTCKIPTKKPPSEESLKAFYKCLNEAKSKPAILKITRPYSLQFVPKICDQSLPTPLTEMYEPEALHSDYLSLLEKCETAFSTIKVLYTHVHLRLSIFKCACTRMASRYRSS